MFLPFEGLGPQSRIWIYQANRALTVLEEKAILEAMQLFCKQWVAHGNALKTSCRIDYGQFLILALDEDFNVASGCSIDGSVQVLKTLQNRLNIDFFDRSQVAFWIEEKVRLFPFKDLKALFSNGILDRSTLAFNTQITTKGVWESDCLRPAGDLWLSRYATDEAIAP